MNFFQKIGAVVTIAGASFTGGLMTSSNSVQKIDPPRVLINAQGHKTYIREAVVWGSWDKIEPDTLVTLWRTKPRKMAAAIAIVRKAEGLDSAEKLGAIEAEGLMLTKAYRESGFCPSIMRFERGRYDGDWKRADGTRIYTEYQATSGGLFQIMGFNYDKLPCPEMNGLADSLKWGYLCANINVQMDLFDIFMADRIKEAARARNGKDLIYKAIAAYGGSASRIESLADMNYATYLNYMQTSTFSYCAKPRQRLKSEPPIYQ